MQLLESSAVQWLFLVIATHSLEVSLGQNVVFVREPQDTKAVSGNDAFFPCTYTGTRVVPHWSVNQTRAYPVSALPSGHSHNDSGLIVHSVDISMNATKYQCCFEFHIGQGVIKPVCSSAGMLIIITTGFIQYPASLVTTPGEMGRFQCTATARSICSIQWRINHTLLLDSDADAYSIPARAGTGVLSSTLHVLATPQHNNSEVECCTYSETGEEICTSSVNLTITGVQNIPGAPALSFLASTSSSLTIEVHLSPEGVPPILSIAVNFTNPSGLVRSVPGPFTPGQMVTTTLSDLEADTEHNFTVFALNFNGISPGSPDTSFRTDQAAEDSLNSGVIAGIAVACIIILGVCITTALCLMCCTLSPPKSKHWLSPTVPTTMTPHQLRRDIEQQAADIRLKVYQVRPDGTGVASRVQPDSSPGSPSAQDDQTRHHKDRIVPDVDQVHYEHSPYAERRKLRLPPKEGRETMI